MNVYIKNRIMFILIKLRGLWGSIITDYQVWKQYRILENLRYQKPKRVRKDEGFDKNKYKDPL